MYMEFAGLGADYSILTARAQSLAESYTLTRIIIVAYLRSIRFILDTASPVMCLGTYSAFIVFGALERNLRNLGCVYR
jgi:hypothetical protein